MAEDIRVIKNVDEYAEKLLYSICFSYYYDINAKTCFGFVTTGATHLKHHDKEREDESQYC